MTDSWTWAVVTQTSPLLVRLDGEATALPVDPDTLTGPLSVGARVWVQLVGRQLVVHGASGGGTLEARLAALEDSQAAERTAFETWTPTLLATAPNHPNIGTTGTKSARRKKIGVSVRWSAFFVTGGTGVSAGSGPYFVAPPYAPMAGYAIVGKGWIYGAAGFVPFIVDGSNGRLIRTDVTMSYIDHTVGLTTAGHVLSLSGEYEATS